MVEAGRGGVLVVVEPEHEAPVAAGARVELPPPGGRRDRVQLRQGERRPRRRVAALHVTRAHAYAHSGAPVSPVRPQRRRDPGLPRPRGLLRLELRHRAARTAHLDEPTTRARESDLTSNPHYRNRFVKFSSSISTIF